MGVERRETHHVEYKADNKPLTPLEEIAQLQTKGTAQYEAMRGAAPNFINAKEQVGNMAEGFANIGKLVAVLELAKKLKNNEQTPELYKALNNALVTAADISVNPNTTRTIDTVIGKIVDIDKKNFINEKQRDEIYDQRRALKHEISIAITNEELQGRIMRALDYENIGDLSEFLESDEIEVITKIHIDQLEKALKNDLPRLRKEMAELDKLSNDLKSIGGIDALKKILSDIDPIMAKPFEQQPAAK